MLFRTLTILIILLDLVNKELSDLKSKLLEATNGLETMESKLSKLQTISEEKKVLEENYSALIEDNGNIKTIHFIQKKLVSNFMLNI